jgi:hypothetical protein
MSAGRGDLLALEPPELVSVARLATVWVAWRAILLWILLSLATATF